MLNLRDEKIIFTKHAKDRLNTYGLSATDALRLIMDSYPVKNRRGDPMPKYKWRASSKDKFYRMNGTFMFVCQYRLDKYSNTDNVVIIITVYDNRHFLTRLPEDHEF